MSLSAIDIVTSGTRGLRRDAEIASGILSQHYRAAIHVSRQRNLHLPHRRAWRWLMNASGRVQPLSLFFEILPTSWLNVAEQAVFVPNQEWIRDEVEQNLRRCRQVWCKSRFALNIFSERELPARYIGFTSSDLLAPSIAKDYGRAIHVAGRSHLKGTRTILDVWSRHPDWPELLVLTRNEAFRRYASSNIKVWVDDIDQATLVTQMNARGIHLCPSETEGYGHYISEALSTRSLVITVDAPPMNELVAPAFGLLAGYHRSEPMSYSTRFFVDPGSLEATIESALNMPAGERALRGELARAEYLERRAEFERALLDAVQQLD